MDGINPNEAVEDGTLLQLACEKKLSKAVKCLVDRGADVHSTTAKNPLVPLKIAAKEGDHRIFKILLPEYDPIPQGILFIYFF